MFAEKAFANAAEDVDGTGVEIVGRIEMGKAFADAGEAVVIQLEAGRVEDFQKNPLFCFYLACYTAQLNRLVESMNWWNKALEIAKKNGMFDQIRLMALDDPDLEPLLKRIGRSD
jgi:hypothetical protein